MKLNSLLSTASLLFAVVTAAPRRQYGGGTEIRWGHPQRAWACPGHANRPLSTLISLPASDMEPTGRGYAACGRAVTLHHRGRTVVGYVADACQECPGPVVAKQLFRDLAGVPNPLRLGVLYNAQWSFGDYAAAPKSSLDATTGSLSKTRTREKYGPSKAMSKANSGNAKPAPVSDSVSAALGDDSTSDPSNPAPKPAPVRVTSPAPADGSTSGSTLGSTSGLQSASSASPNGSDQLNIAKPANEMEFSIDGVLDSSVIDEPDRNDPDRFELDLPSVPPKSLSAANNSPNRQAGLKGEAQ
ncbi:MAG: hypothetical protein M1816_004314 [Peltula sp. TS41687]|nr:MAG: hypothetical protein M1816_004314 [Peltula sp. TS41687]